MKKKEESRIKEEHLDLLFIALSNEILRLLDVYLTGDIKSPEDYKNMKGELPYFISFSIAFFNFVIHIQQNGYYGINLCNLVKLRPNIKNEFSGAVAKLKIEIEEEELTADAGVLLKLAEHYYDEVTLDGLEAHHYDD